MAISIQGRLHEGSSAHASGGEVQIKTHLKWEPKVPLREGLAKMVDDFSSRLDVPKPKIH